MRRDWKKELKLFVFDTDEDIPLDILRRWAKTNWKVGDENADDVTYTDYHYPESPYELSPKKVIAFIDSLLSEQEAEWKQNMRAAIDETAVVVQGLVVDKVMRQELMHESLDDTTTPLFKKYNCEEEKK